MAKSLHATPDDYASNSRVASPPSAPRDSRRQARTTRPRTQPTGAEEGNGLLFRNGVFVASVRYTLVAFESDKLQSPASESTRVIYTAVLHFEAGASDTSHLLLGAGQVFELETANGLRLACVPVESLGSSQLRWIVRLTAQTSGDGL